MTDTGPALDDRQRWANRRPFEADAAALTAARCRRAILDAIDIGDPKMLRAASVAYSLLIQQAQNLSGTTDENPDERKGTALDELDQRRARRATGTAVRTPTG